MLPWRELILQELLFFSYIYASFSRYYFCSISYHFVLWAYLQDADTGTSIMLRIFVPYCEE